MGWCQDTKNISYREILFWIEHFRYEEHYPSPVQKSIARLCLEVARKFSKDPGSLKQEDFYSREEYIIPEKEIQRFLKRYYKEQLKKQKEAQESGEKPVVELNEQQKQSQAIWKTAIQAASKNRPRRGKDGNRPRCPRSSDNRD